MRGKRRINVVDHLRVHVVGLDGLQSQLEVRATGEGDDSTVAHVVVNLEKLIRGEDHHTANQEEQEQTRNNTHLHNMNSSGNYHFERVGDGQRSRTRNTLHKVNAELQRSIRVSTATWSVFIFPFSDLRYSSSSN